MKKRASALENTTEDDAAFVEQQQRDRHREHRERVRAILELPLRKSQRRRQRAGLLLRAVAIGTDTHINCLAPLQAWAVQGAKQAGVIEVLFMKRSRIEIVEQLARFTQRDLDQAKAIAIAIRRLRLADDRGGAAWELRRVARRL